MLFSGRLVLLTALMAILVVGSFVPAVDALEIEEIKSDIGLTSACTYYIAYTASDYQTALQDVYSLDVDELDLRHGDIKKITLDVKVPRGDGTTWQWKNLQKIKVKIKDSEVDITDKTKYYDLDSYADDLVDSIEFRICGNYQLEQTSRGFTIEADHIPSFKGVLYPEYAWWNVSWGYRREIIANFTDGNSEVEYVVFLNISNSTNHNPDWNDTRFLSNTSSNAENVSFCIGQGCGLMGMEAFNSEYAEFGIRFPIINGSVYMYYGNPDASNSSNATLTFDYFNDFETDSMVAWTNEAAGGWYRNDSHSYPYGTHAAMRNNNVDAGVSFRTAFDSNDCYNYSNAEMPIEFTLYIQQADVAGSYVGGAVAYYDTSNWNAMGLKGNNEKRVLWVHEVGGAQASASGLDMSDPVLNGTWKYEVARLYANGTFTAQFYHTNGSLLGQKISPYTTPVAQSCVGIMGYRFGYVDTMTSRKIHTKPNALVVATTGEETPSGVVTLLNIVSPANTTYYNDEYVPLSVTITNPATNSLWYYSINGDANRSYTPNTSIFSPSGSNNVTVWLLNNSVTWFTDTEYWTWGGYNCSATLENDTICGGDNMKYVMPCIETTDDFYQWDTQNMTYCKNGCLNGVCLELQTLSNHKCQLNQTVCLDNFNYIGCYNDAGIYRWNTTEINCPTGCLDGYCITIFSDCVIGESKCVGNTIVFCDDDNNDGTYEWSSVNRTYCDYGCDEKTSGTYVTGECDGGSARSFTSIRELFVNFGESFDYIFGGIPALKMFIFLAISLCVGGVVGIKISWRVGLAGFIGMMFIGFVVGWVYWYVLVLFIFICGLVFKLSRSKDVDMG